MIAQAHIQHCVRQTRSTCAEGLPLAKFVNDQDKLRTQITSLSNYQKFCEEMSLCFCAYCTKSRTELVIRASQNFYTTVSGFWTENIQ